MGRENQTKRFKTWKKYIFDFQQFETIRSFCDNMYTGKFNIDEAELIWFKAIY